MEALPLQHHAFKFDDYSLHGVEAGSHESDTIVFLHGWPEDWTEWKEVIQLAGKTHRILAFDLPGIGESHGPVPNGEKSAISTILHEAIQTLGLHKYTIVGHDIGAMVAYSYLRSFPNELNAAVLMDSVIPGVQPWQKTVANPHIWHFAFHTIPHLPEALVTGRELVYFDYFFDTLAKDPSAINSTARAHYAEAYGTAGALRSGLDWYRAFANDAKTNGDESAEINVPLLYLRGEFEGGEMDEYIAGFKQAGLRLVTATRIPGSGHYTPEENPKAVWIEIAEFLKKYPQVR